MKGPIGWIIYAIIAGFLYAAYQSFDDWLRNSDKPKQEQTVKTKLNEQVDSLHVGAITIALPKTWQISSGSEANQVKAEMEKSVQQTVEQYKTETGIETGDFGMGEFKAIRISDNSGWCILYVVNIPQNKDYYQTIAKDNKKKLEWGMQQGVFKEVIVNGIVKIGDKDVMKTILLRKDGGRLITIIYWSPNEPSVITNLVIMESKINNEIKKQIDNVCGSLQIN